MSSHNSQRSSLSSQNRKIRYRALLEDLSTLELFIAGVPHLEPVRHRERLKYEEENNDNVQQMERTAGAVKEVQSLLAEGGVEERVKHPGEGYLDSRVLRATSDLALRCSEAVSGNVNTYDKHELAAHIRENPEFWEFVFPREVPAVSSLFGTFAATPPEQRARKARRRVEKQQTAALKAPESVDKLEKTEEGSEMVSRVYRFLSKACRNGPVSYFRLVLDPDSFARTVENIYYVSFLVRDGMVAIDLDEERGLPFIKSVPASQQEERNPSGENQFIVSIDMARWQKLVAAFNIQSPMMVLKRN